MYMHVVVAIVCVCVCVCVCVSAGGGGGWHVSRTETCVNHRHPTAVAALVVASVASGDGAAAAAALHAAKHCSKLSPTVPDAEGCPGTDRLWHMPFLTGSW